MNGTASSSQFRAVVESSSLVGKIKVPLENPDKQGSKAQVPSAADTSHYCMQGGYDKEGVFVPGPEPMLPYFDRMARNVSGCVGDAEGEKIIMGPSWDNVSRLLNRMVVLLLHFMICHIKKVP